MTDPGPPRLRARRAPRLAAALVATAVTALVACGAPPEPWRPSPWVARTNHRAGGLLTTLSADVPDVPAAEACLAVDVEWLLLDRPPASAGEADELASRTELVAGLGTQLVLLPAPSLGLPVRVWRPPVGVDETRRLVTDAAGRWEQVVAPGAALGPGVTASFTLVDPGARERFAQGEDVHPLLVVMAHRPDAGEDVHVAFCLEQWVEATPHPFDLEEPAALESAALEKVERELDAEDLRAGAPQPPSRADGAAGGDAPAPESVAAAPPEQVVECDVLVDVLAPQAPPLALWVPLPSPAAPEAGALVLARVARAPAGDAFAMREHARRVAASRAALARPEAPDREPPPRTVARAQAFASLADPARRRDALSYLSRRTGAELAADLALVADTALLARTAEALAAALPDGPPPDDPGGEALGWILEREALRLLGGAVAVTDPDPMLEGVLVSRTGESARYPTHLVRLADRLHGLAELEWVLVRENRIALDDPSAAVRLRAYDWLRARGDELAGYAPLDELGPRREAMKALPPQPPRPRAPEAAP